MTIKGHPTVLDPAINPIIFNHNAMAAQVMSAANVPVNDLYTLMVNRLDLARGDQFHWKPLYYLLPFLASGSLLDFYLSRDFLCVFP